MGWGREIGGKPAGPGLIPVRVDGWIFVSTAVSHVLCSLCSWKLGSRLLLDYVAVVHGAAWVGVPSSWWSLLCVSLSALSPPWGAVPCYLHWC